MEKDIKQELAVWKKWIFNNMPIAGLDVKVLCTYVEAFAIPFKFKNQRIVTYNHPVKNLYIRREYWEDAELLSSEGVVNNTFDAVGQFPEKFVMDTAKNFAGIASQYKAVQTERLPVGRCTGRYYIDLYGYCWFEIANNFLNKTTTESYGDAHYSWVRETAVNYEGKEELQAVIAENRTLVMQMREGGANKPNKAKAIGFLSILSLFLSR